MLALPASALAAIDRWWAPVLSPGGRLVLWGMLGAMVSVGLYELLLPQARVARAKADVETARRQLAAYDGELAGALPLMKRQIGAALRQLLLVAPPAVVAMLPVIWLASWLELRYGQGKHYLHFGPGWLRGWGAVFFAGLLVAALALQVLKRLVRCSRKR
ncbi:MAG: hypothetical protein KGJ55_06730 [Gammaproteobacteria bacterium]|nr:hypothetical protein [Gammaproteobacteria bacterium]